jgi:hypothetical protein
MSFIGKAVGSITGSTKAAESAQEGAAIQANAQREALDYLKETEAIPQELREGALTTLGGLYGIGGNPNEALARITNSAAYQNVLGSRAAGEEAILRNAGATGGLRSGNASDALARYNMDLQQQAYNTGLQGLSGLAQLPSNANTIANSTAGIGQTLGQGQVAAGQAIQAGRGLALSSAVSAGGSVYGGSALGSGISFSDTRLKSNIKPAGTRNGFPWYTWTWNDEAANLGLFGDDEGVMAHEVADIKPEAIRLAGQYLTVDYSALGVQ